MTTKMQTLDQGDVDNKPMGSGGPLVSIDKLSVVMFETKPLRLSSYITCRRLTVISIYICSKFW